MAAVDENTYTRDETKQSTVVDLEPLGTNKTSTGTELGVASELGGPTEAVYTLDPF